MRPKRNLKEQENNMIANKPKSLTNARNANTPQRARLEGLLFSGACVEMIGLGSVIKWPERCGE
jgi:hypothetical protein